MIKVDQLCENSEELMSYCDLDSVDHIYRDKNKCTFINEIKSIDSNAEKERKILYCIAMFRLYELLDYKSLKSLLESNIITSKCPQECYKQINRAKTELMIHDGDFNKVGLMPSSHLDMFSLIPIDSKSSCELTARVKSVYRELYTEKSSKETVTARDVKEHILEKFQRGKVAKTVSSTSESDEKNHSKDTVLDWGDDEPSNTIYNMRENETPSDTNSTNIPTSPDSFESLVINEKKFTELLRYLSRSLNNDKKIRLAYSLNQSLLDTEDASLLLLLKGQKISKNAFICSLKRMKYYQTKVFI